MKAQGKRQREAGRCVHFTDATTVNEPMTQECPHAGTRTDKGGGRTRSLSNAWNDHS